MQLTATQKIRCGDIVFIKSGEVSVCKANSSDMPMFFAARDIAKEETFTLVLDRTSGETPVLVSTMEIPATPNRIKSRITELELAVKLLESRFDEREEYEQEQREINQDQFE